MSTMASNYKILDFGSYPSCIIVQIEALLFLPVAVEARESGTRTTFNLRLQCPIKKIYRFRYVHSNMEKNNGKQNGKELQEERKD